MNPIQDEKLDPPRILGRLLAMETSFQELDENHGGETARPTYTLTYPPDRDWI